MSRLIFILFLSGTFLVCSCANKVAPTGGEKDIELPKLLNARPENYSLNFTSKEVVLTFNEYVQLIDLQKQVLVSPPLATAPEIEIRKKSIVISLPDTLRTNTTYSIYFGNAIADFTEGNILPGFQYVFSTGPEIDSLVVNGQVLNALTRKPVKNALVFLYPEGTADSLIGMALPLYYARASENGLFSARSVHEGTYIMAAVDDQNNNFAADFAEEAVGILKNSHLTSDTLPVTILLNRQPPALQFIKSTHRESPGKLTTVFAKPVENLSFRFLADAPESVITEFNFSRDTVVLYGIPGIRDSAEVIVSDNGVIIDTAVYVSRKTKIFTTADSSVKATGTTFPLPGAILPAESRPSIKWNFPLRSFDFSKVRAFMDSVEIMVNARLDDTLKSHLVFDGNWKAGSYKIELLPGAAVDIYGNTNDSLQLTFTVPEENAYGSIAINFITDEMMNYLVQIVNDKDVVQRQRNTTGGMEGVFARLDPGIYQLRIIEDHNKNNRWDGGNWSLRQWPETVIYYPDVITVRANWEVEINWKFPQK